ncbi:hypothetical protein L3V59_33325 [Burkholderia aenigmatica]|nr:MULTISPECIES: hypothetical protein [Burkholderia]MCA8294107.1 hypothetical protein [Burkholderia sp. AU30198]UKD14548.1 hypothetical protein L3V59_33325 [Burkholderia aenigmatica]
MSLKFKMIVLCIVLFRYRVRGRRVGNIAIALPILESVRIVKVRDK